MSNPERTNYLYLYDLPKQTTNSNQIAMIIKDKTGFVLEIKPQIRRELNRPFCTAIVNIADNESFSKAVKELRYFEYEGKMCRGLPFDNSLHGANQQRLHENNVFISKIPKDNQHNSKWLDDFCKQFGEIKSLKISLNPEHTSRGYGFVCFQEPSSAAKCLAEQGGKSEICAIKYQPRDKREFRRVFNNIYAKNLPDDWDEEKARQCFQKYGPIGMLKFAKNQMGSYAMVAYFSENKEDRETGPKAAAAAVDDLNGKEINGKKLYVKQFLNKADREQEIQRDLMKYKNSKKKCNLFVKNIPDQCTEKEVKDLFGRFGEIESVKLFPKEKGKNPFCFVCFLKPDCAQKAKEDLQSAEFMGRQLQINHYEIKEIRKLHNEENQDKIDFIKFRQQYGGASALQNHYKPEVLIEMIKKILQELAPQGYKQGTPRLNNNYGMQNQGQPRQNVGGRTAPNNNRDARSQGRPIQGGQNQRPMNMGGVQQPMQQMPQQMPNQMGGMPGFQQPMQQPQQPTSMKEAYLMRCAPLVKGVVEQNPYYKQQVGTAIFGFVDSLKGGKAPKITGMLIDLNIPEIHNILQNYEHFCMRVEQADQLITSQMNQAQNTPAPQ